MAFSTLLLLVALINAAQLTAVYGACPRGWNRFGDFCYMLSQAPWPYDIARSLCQSNQAELASILSTEENLSHRILGVTIIRCKFTEYLKPIVVASRELHWFGLHRNSTGGPWMWTDGSALVMDVNDKSLWKRDCPEQCDGNCLEMRFELGEWQNYPCDQRRRFICKRHYDTLDLCNVADGWQAFGNQCYKYNTDRRTWQEAARACAIHDNSQLVTLNSADKFGVLEHVVSCKDFEAAVWIGLSDTNDTENWKWLDGSQATVFNWATNQPDKASEPGNNCVSAMPLMGYQWTVENCPSENEYVCERPQGTCAEGWMDHGTGNCYLPIIQSTQLRSWSDAELHCQRFGTGGHLMKITNANEQKAMRDMVAQMATSRVNRVYIGLSDKTQDNIYRWSDGSALTYQHFNYWERVPKRVDCGFVDYGQDNTNASWSTGYCFRKEAFICQIPIHSSPKDPQEPGGWTCPDGTETDQQTGRCYTFSTEALNFNQARDRCTENGMKLLTLTDTEDQSFVSNRLTGSTWTGLEYKGNGIYGWYDNTMLKFQNWEQGGNAGDADHACVIMRSSPFSGAWLFRDCQMTNYYICFTTGQHVTGTTPVPAPTGAWSPQCGSGWRYNPMNEACYSLNHDVATFNTAEMRCSNAGGHLASIHGDQEQSFISGMVMNSFGSLNYWIGANDRDETRGWQWTDGSPFYYWYWNNDEPNNKDGKEFCVELSAELMQARWNDIDCDRLFGYICKKPSTAATPHPSAEPTKAPVTCDSPQPVVSGIHYIRDLGLYASTSADGRLPKYARLNNVGTSSIPGSWTTASVDSDRWITAVFTHYMIIAGVQTRGASDRDEWVTSYSVAYRLQYATFFVPVVNSTGNAMIFTGNSDRNSVVEQKFESTILAHAVRIRIRTFQTAASMRFELLGCRYESCNPDALVSGDSMVPDVRLTASGSWDDNHGPHRGRIHLVKEGEYRGGWIANYPWTNEQWIQAEFDTTMAIYAIQTKGRQDYPQWASSYKLLYTDDLNSWEVYQEPYGTAKIFPANNDEDTLVTNYLAANIYGVKYVRINPQTWSGNGMGLRFEILGCNAHYEGCTDIPLLSGQNSYVPNSRLTASSSYASSTGPSRSRLNLRAGSGLAGAWVPAENNVDQWIQVDLGKRNLILAVATQGRDDVVMYLTAYSLSYGDDGINFIDYPNGTKRIFEGNWDNTRVHKYFLTPTFEARFIRLHPVQWNVSIAVRWEVYACAGWATYSVIGCYRDTNEVRDLDGSVAWYPPDGMTLDKCAQYCRMEGFLYAGTQYGYECFCGNRYGRFGPSDQCNSVCSGDPIGRSVCGGPNANTIMHTGVYSPDQVVGCFSDNLDRDLPYEAILYVPGGNTQQFCALHCFNKGYRYAAAQFGIECYCGNTYGRYGPSSKCNVKCPGDHSGLTFCGGDWSNTVISTGLAPDHLGCREGFSPYGNHCYKFVNQRMTWTNADSTCRSMGAQLATINYPSVQDFITSKLVEYGMEFWNGLHCRRRNNFFEWTGGAPVLYTNWARREPNAASADENCVMMYQNGRWNDDPCTNEGRQFGAACQMDKEEMQNQVTPTPDPTCPSHWQGFRWKCYTLVVATWSWALAKEQCEGLGGNLARIEDSYEQSFLTSTYIRTRGFYWIDIKEKNWEFSFSNGDRPPFTNWGTDEPADNQGYGCVGIDMEAHGMWKNTKCDRQVYSICEMNRMDPTRPPVSPTNPGQGSCAAGWTPMGTQHCFNLFAPSANLRLTWVQALAACRDIGAELVSIHSREENNQLQIATMSKIGDFWIGLSATTSGGFQWSDGSPVDFENWSGPGRVGTHSGDEEFDVRTTTDKNCVGMYQSIGAWHRLECDALKNWICKIRRGVNPSLTTTIAPPSPGPPGSCAPDNDNWKFFNDRCYFVSQQHVQVTDWWEAEEQCRQNGGHLASIHSLDEQRFLEGQIGEVLQSFGVWLGLNDVNAQGTWQWTDDSPTDYVHWGQGSPTGERSLCVAFNGRSGGFGHWIDVHCQTQYPYVCSKIRGGTTIVTPTPVPMSGYCPSGFVSFYNKCFRIVEEPATWTDANSRCQQMGARPYGLVSISDKIEQAFLTSHLANRPSREYWIGLHQYSGIAGEFGWIDNTKVSYTNWAQQRPSGAAGRDCVFMFTEPFRAGEWTDGTCSSTLPFICMRLKDPSIATPPPNAANTCPSNYMEWQGNCYRGLSGTRSWQESENECAKDNGHLTSVLSRYEQGLVASHFTSVGNELWIGLSDKQAPGRYTWSDSASVTYTSWTPGAPISTAGGCVYMSRSKSNDWSDSPCEASYAAVCKITRVPPVVTRPPPGGCPSDNFGNNWMEFDNHCYLFKPNAQVVFNNASVECQLAGGYLASIHSNEENAFIYSHLSPNTEQMQWIGMIRNPAGGFIWLDGSNQGYFKWNDGEPNSVEEKCVEMYMHNGGWNDIGCESRNGFVCKKRRVDSSGNELSTTTRPPVMTSTMILGPSSTASTASTPFVPPTNTRRTTYEMIPPDNGGGDGGGSQMSSADIVGIVFGCLLLAILTTVTGLVYVMRRRSALNVSFSNPSFNS